MKLSNVIRQFHTSRALSVRERTLEWYHYNLDPLSEALGDCPIEQVTTADLEAFLGIQAQGRSPRTREGFYTVLNTLFKWAVERGLLSADTNPMNPIKSPRRQRRKKIPDFFSDAQIRALLRAVGNLRDRVIVLTLLDTGVRRGELVSLNIEDVDFAEGFLLIRNGKGGKDRYVPIGAKVIAALQEMLVDHPRHGPLFRNCFGKRLRAGGLRSMLLRLKERAQLKCRVYPHKFRHTFARNYLKRGDLESLRAILGHESITLTSQVYGSFLRGGIKEKHQRCSPVQHNNWEQLGLW